MERDNFEISQELEQMREQFRILTEKVEKQNIVYEKQLRASMRKRVNSYNLWEVWMPIVVIIGGCPLIYELMIQRAGMPVWTSIMLWAYFAIAIVESTQADSHIANFDKVLQATNTNIPVYLLPITDLKNIYNQLYLNIPNN